MAFIKVLVSPKFTFVQVVPLSVERNTPLNEPTKTLVPFVTKQFTLPPKGPLV
jgi:hypothetical protein